MNEPTGARAPDEDPGDLDSWLSSREPAPPPALAARVRELVREARGHDLPATLLAAAEGALRRLVRTGGSDRTTAIDLLAVDALVTYAFEAAARAPATIPACAAEAMARLSAAATP